MNNAKIAIRCPSCRQKYSIKAKFENKYLDCVKCGDRFKVVQPVKLALDGHLVDAEPVVAELMEPSTHDSRKLISGRFEEIFNSKPVLIENPLDDGPTIDILIFGPAQNRPFYSFATCGMSSQTMAGNTNMPYIELLIFAQPEFDIASEEGAMLYVTMALWANMPFQSGNPFLHGQALNFDEQTPVHPASDAIHWGLLNPQLVSRSLRPQKVGSEKTIHFLWMLPIYIEEFLFKKQNGIHQLEQKLFSELPVHEIVRFDRRNVCKPSIVDQTIGRFFKR